MPGAKLEVIVAVHSYFASLHTHVALSRYASELIHVLLRASSHAHV